MHRAVSRLATAAVATGAAATSNPPSTATSEAYHPSNSLRFTNAYTDFSQHSSVISHGSASEWNLLSKEELQRSGCLGPVPSQAEVEEATRYVLGNLYGEPAVDSIFSDTSAPDSWPEADASMAASEAAITVARQALRLSENSMMAHQEMMGLVYKNKPRATENLLESLVLDPKVWNAIEQNKDLQEFMIDANRADYSPDSVQDVTTPKAAIPDTKAESETDCKAAHNAKEENGLQHLFHDMVVRLGSIVGSISSFFEKMMNGQREAPAKAEEAAASAEKGQGLKSGIMILVILIVGVIFIKRRM